jgi:gliding motility-associated-like protein
MKKIPLFDFLAIKYAFLFCLFLGGMNGVIFAQNLPEQDCFGALSVCQSSYSQSNSYMGSGIQANEINTASSCLSSGEKNDVWYIFTVQISGTLCFSIAPNNPNDDYDWAVYNLTTASCTDIFSNPSLEVSCNYSPNQGCNGVTGANGQNTTGTACDLQNEACLTVLAGETYVLNVSNFSNTQSGYLLDFNPPTSPSSAQIFDNTPPTIQSITTNCVAGYDTYFLQFSENVLCSSVEPTDFMFTGPGGVNYTITSITGTACQTGGKFENQFVLKVSPIPAVVGTYTLDYIGQIVDNCGNVAIPSSKSFTISNNLQAFTSKTRFCDGGNVTLSTNINDTTNYTFSWVPGNFTQSQPVLTPTTTTTYTVYTTDQNSCVKSAEILVEVAPKPIFDISFDKQQVCGPEWVNMTYSGNVSPEYMAYWDYGNPSIMTIDSLGVYHLKWNTNGDHYVALYYHHVEFGCNSALAAQVVTVNPLPTADFEGENVCTLINANFTDKSSIENNTNGSFLTNWLWNMDNLALVSGQNPQFSFATAGVKNIGLTVTTDKGCVDSIFKQVNVFQLPDSAEVTTDTVCRGEAISIKAETPAGTTVYWYNDPTIAQFFHVGNLYNTPPLENSQTYYIEIENTKKCRTPRMPINAGVAPVQTVQILAPTEIDIPTGLVNFDAQGSFPFVVYHWKFGDGDSAKFKNPIHNYTYPSHFIIELTALDTFGCEAKDWHEIEATMVRSVFVPTAFTPNGDGFNDVLVLGTFNVREFDFQVFDKWGKLMYETKDPTTAWDAHDTKGKVVPEGVYMYVVRGYLNDGNKINERGTITIVR